MAKWGEDFDTWEPTQDYTAAPPARSAQLGQTPRRPSPPPSSTDAHAAGFFQEFSQAAEAAGNAGSERTPELPYGDNPGIAALIANAQNMLNSDGPDAPDRYRDGFASGVTPELPEAMRGTLGAGGTAGARGALPARVSAEELPREDSARASVASRSNSWFGRGSRREDSRRASRWSASEPSRADEVTDPRQGFDSGNGLAYGALLDEGTHPHSRFTPATASNQSQRTHSEGWQSLMNGWDDVPETDDTGEAFAELPASPRPNSPKPPVGARETPRKEDFSALDFFASDTAPDDADETPPREQPTPSQPTIWKSVSAATPDGPTKLRFRRVDEVPAPAARPASAYRADGISPVAMIAVAVLLSLIGVGVGVGVGMNLSPAPAPTVTVSPSDPVDVPTGDSPDSVSNQDNATNQVGSTATGGLNGLKVVLDPGHNGGNAAAWQQIGQNVDDGRGGQQACNTTGTAAADGFSEHEFNWNVANLLKTKLEVEGATVVLTRDSDVGVGPCVNDRGAFPQKVGADVMVSIHGNGTTNTSVHGFFAMISEPPLNDAQKEPASKLATALVTALKNGGLTPQSNGPIADGIWKRSDLATLNFSEVPAVMVELGEMRNPADATLMKSDAGQDKYATALFNGLKAWAEETRPPSPAASASPSASGSSGTPAVAEAPDASASAGSR
ncbi:N-acetylmuramoyl-L-alanine amidase [Mobiluncus porci]|uniref:N-acetylmuramoyl-L-alanine amidase n=1 Tax=Mobiluncus porci TaxID=2652278 RepID=A0A7K0K4Z2_9ACTO|nr:N-acetylmuramoyl-L-alanine amidase [Mobiluncus porci]MST50547.1 N-acetylmuramoyl-L-alanine amidase [Mobiluncus porci]